MPVPVDVEVAVTFKGRIFDDEVLLSKSEIIETIGSRLKTIEDDQTEIIINSLKINGVEAELVD